MVLLCLLFIRFPLTSSRLFLTPPTHSVIVCKRSVVFPFFICMSARFMFWRGRSWYVCCWNRRFVIVLHMWSSVGRSLSSSSTKTIVLQWWTCRRRQITRKAEGLNFNGWWLTDNNWKQNCNINDFLFTYGRVLNLVML